MKYNPSLKQFREMIQTAINALSESGDITTSELQEDSSRFTIFEGWQPVHKLYTLTAIYSKKYHLYKKACQFAQTNDRSSNKHGSIQVYDRSYFLMDDFRLAESGLFPMDDTDSPHWYTIPDSIQPYVDILESELSEWGFSDEYTTCSNCCKIIRTSPDSYDWQRDYYLGDGKILCPDCIDTESILEEYANTNHSVPPFILHRSDCNLVELDREFSNGFHPGQDDSPAKIIKAFKDSGIDIWFKISPSQFYIDFKVLVSPEDELAAGQLIDKVNAYQGYSTSGELQKALQGKAAEITVTTTRLTDQGYITSTNNDSKGESNE